MAHTLDPAHTVALLNPAARAGANGRERDALIAALHAAIGPVTVHTTAPPGDPNSAEALAEHAVRGGAQAIVSIGGDGTHSQILNGMLRARPPGASVPPLSLATLPAGTGNDFCRLLRTGGDLSAGLRALGAPHASPIDVGRAHIHAPRHGSPRCFLNVLGCGINGLANDLISQTPKTLGPTWTFVGGTLRALRAYTPAQVALDVDGHSLGVAPILTLSVGNGASYGGGMRITPDALLDDGLLDVTLIRPAPLTRHLGTLARLYRGTIAGSPLVQTARGARITIRPVGPHPASMELDGEPQGNAPVTLEALPQAIRAVNVHPRYLTAPP